MKELDVVKLTRDYPELGLRAGAFGTIVHEHVEVAGVPKAYIIEFTGLDTPYNSIVEDIAADHLRLATKAELEALRSKGVAAE